MHRFISHKEYARYLRKNMTVAEIIMWDRLRNRKLAGYKFLRQHPIKIPRADCRDSFYFADFYCAEKKLVIEIDGSVHALQTDYDAGRDFVMHEWGYSVLRIRNEEVMVGVEAVLERIKLFLDSSPGPFSTGREGE